MSLYIDTYIDASRSSSLPLGLLTERSALLLLVIAV